MMFMREWLHPQEIEDLKNNGKLRDTPDIEIFGEHRKIIKVMSNRDWLFERKDICVGYAVKDYRTGVIL